MNINYNLKFILILSIFIFSISNVIGCESKDNENKVIQQSQDTKGYENLDAKQTEKLLNEGKNILVIDVRSDNEYEKGHLINAINIPYDDDFKSELREIKDYKDKTILVYCKTGNRSEKAAVKLVDNGFKNIKNATEGIDEYNYKLVKVNNITGKEAEEIIRDANNDKVDYSDSYDDIVIIDVRDEKDFKNGHIENAINIPIKNFDTKINELNKSIETIVYGSRGKISAQVAEKLVENKFDDVSNVAEGTSEYNFKLIK